jgi:hypothetical protein
MNKSAEIEAGAHRWHTTPGHYGGGGVKASVGGAPQKERRKK